MTDGIDPIEMVRRNLAAAEDANRDGVPSNGPQGNDQGVKVTHIRSDPSQLRPRANTILHNMLHAGDVKPLLSRKYLIKGWLDTSSVSVVYGPSNVGKSFLALNIAHHVSKGLEWGNRRVKKGRVIYFAAEGGATLANRVAALDGPEFWLHMAPLVLTGRDSQAGPVAEVLQHLEAVGGSPFDLIIFDTMARVMGGGDENNAPDIADLMRNLDLIRRATGAHVMLIHHSGKDVGRGAREHSALRAAIDTEIELVRDDLGQITAEVTKQRDGPTGGRFAYKLRQVELGEDQDGDIVTTCLVEPADASEADRVGVTGSVRRALELLSGLIADRGEIVRKAQYPGTACIAFDVWREACVAPGNLSPSSEKETRERTFRRANNSLTEKHLVVVRDGLVWLVEQ